MCINCAKEGIGRRDLVRLGAAGVLALGLGGLSGRARAANAPPTALAPDEALAQLKGGNERFVSHPELCSVDLAQSRSAVAGHQRLGRRSSLAPTAGFRPNSFSAVMASANCSSRATPAIS
jgi:hypothetical protein